MVRSRKRNLLYAFVALAVSAPAAHAESIYDKAWTCASTVVEGVEDLHGDGAKALMFIAMPGGAACVTRLGTPMTAAPIALVLTLANTGVLNENCSGTLYTTAAKPIAYGLGKALGALGILKPPAEKFLAKIVAGQAAGEALQAIPGIEIVTGSLTCGCDFYDAGLSVDTVKRVLNTADRVGDACGGEVWTATKKVAGAVGEVAGDAVQAGVLAASNAGDWLAGQDKNISNTAYFEEYWQPNLEDFATVEFSSPGAWHDREKWRELWEPCVSYFDTHTLSGANARNVCDDMRSGNSHPNYFEGNGFSQRMFRRVFEFDVTGAVDAARKQAYIDYADMKSGMDVPQEIVDDTDAYIDITTKSHAEQPRITRTAVDAVFGIPTKEKRHDGLVVANSAPPTTWPVDTVGGRALAFYDQVKAADGNHRADAAKAVQLAMQDMDARELVRGKTAEQMLAFYKERYDQIRTGRNVVSAQAQGQVDALIAACPSQACRDTIADEWATCSAASEAFAADNASAIANFDSPQGQSVRAEYGARARTCLDQAKRTGRSASTAELGDRPASTQMPTTRCGPGGARNCQGPLSDGVPATHDGNRGRENAQGTATRYEVSPVDARALHESVGRRVSIPQASSSAGQADSSDEDSGDGSERRHDDLPANARITPGSLGVEASPSDDFPGCTTARSRGEWICEDREAYDRCLAAKRRGAARGCALQTP